MSLHLILLRHGATAGNQERRYVGRTDDSPLSADGEALLTARRTRGTLPRADALYSSPLRRCTQTARLLYPMLVPVVLPSLAEMDFGVFEGKTYDQLKDDPAYRRWIDTRGLAAPPGGEGARDFRARLHGALGQLAADDHRSGFRSAVVITHGGCIMQLLCTDPENADMYDYQAPNGGGFTAELDTATLQLTDIRRLG